MINLHHDNGSEFEKDFKKACLELSLPQWYSRVRTPTDNPVLERFNRTIQEEFVEMIDIGLEDVVEFISVFLDYTENEDLPALLEGINKRDAEVVRKRAHSIKGAALNLMLSEISSLAAQLEKNAAVGKIDDSLSIYTDILERMKVVRETLT